MGITNEKELNTSFKSNIEYKTVNDDISNCLCSSNSSISSEMKSKKTENTKCNKGYMHKSPLDSQDSSTVISTNSGDMKQTKSSIMNKKDEKKYTNRIQEASKSARELSEKLKVIEGSARRIKKLAEDIKDLNEGENYIKLSSDSKYAIHDFLESIEGAKQSLEQTKEIVNDTKQTANDEKIDTEKNILMM